MMSWNMENNIGEKNRLVNNIVSYLKIKVVDKPRNYNKEKVEDYLNMWHRAWTQKYKLSSQL